MARLSSKSDLVPSTNTKKACLAIYVLFKQKQRDTSHSVETIFNVCSLDTAKNRIDGIQQDSEIGLDFPVTETTFSHGVSTKRSGRWAKEFLHVFQHHRKAHAKRFDVPWDKFVAQPAVKIKKLSYKFPTDCINYKRSQKRFFSSLSWLVSWMCCTCLSFQWELRLFLLTNFEYNWELKYCSWWFHRQVCMSERSIRQQRASHAFWNLPYL